MKHPALLQLLCFKCIILLLLSGTLPFLTCTSSVAAAAYSQTGKEIVIFEFFYSCSKSHACSFFFFLYKSHPKFQHFHGHPTKLDYQSNQECKNSLHLKVGLLSVLFHVVGLGAVDSSCSSPEEGYSITTKPTTAATKAVTAARGSSSAAAAIGELQELTAETVMELSSGGEQNQLNYASFCRSFSTIYSYHLF
jgi:hypothetical protein